METYMYILAGLFLLALVFRASQMAFYYIIIGSMIVGAYYMYSRYGAEQTLDMVFRYVNIMQGLLR